VFRATEVKGPKSFLFQAPFQNTDYRFKNVVQCIYKRKQIDFLGFVTFFVVEGFSLHDQKKATSLFT